MTAPEAEDQESRRHLADDLDERRIFRHGLTALVREAHGRVNTFHVDLILQADRNSVDWSSKGRES